MGRQLGGLSLPGLLPLLSLLLLLVGGDGGVPAGETVSGPRVVQGQTDAVVAGVIPVRLQIMSLLVSRLQVLFLLISYKGVLYDRGGMTGQEVWPRYQGWGQVGDERVAATDKYWVRRVTFVKCENRAYPSIGEEGSEDERSPSLSLSILQKNV